MIFITVGTHEQGLDRLLIEIDRLIEKKVISEEVCAQVGYSEYKPKKYNFKKMIGYDEMDNYVKKSDIIITHGGPGSIFHPIQYGKIPIVVPRNPDFNEHVDNHQILFTKRLENSCKVIGVYDIEKLEETIKNYNMLSAKCSTNAAENHDFISRFSELLENRFNFT